MTPCSSRSSFGFIPPGARPNITRQMYHLALVGDHLQPQWYLLAATGSLFMTTSAGDLHLQRPATELIDQATI
jgi:hypothetical protein